MTYKCVECGHMFDEGEQAVWEENQGEYWGSPAMETMSGCPRCKGGYEETVPCERCGSMHLEEELVEGWCEDCIDQYRNDIEMCYKTGECDNVPVAINGFLAAMFEEEEINQILMNALRESRKYGPVDCSVWIYTDKEAFVSMAKEVE